MPSTRTATATTDWRLRPLRPSDAVVWVVGQVREMTNTGLEMLGVIGAAVLLAWYFLLPNPMAAAVLVAGSMVAGGLLVWTTKKEGAVGPITTRRAVALLIAASNSGWLLLFLLPGSRWAAVVGLAWWEVLSRRPSAKARKDPWWSHWRIATAFVTAGVLRMEKLGDGIPDQLPTIGFIGKRRETEYGTWQTFRLPPGSTWHHAREKHSALASAIGIPENLLHIEHDPEQPANAVTLAVLNRRELRAPVAVLPERTDFRQPVPLGTDRLGAEQYLKTQETHTAFVGKTRSGKTWLARYFVSWGLLDPRVPVWMVSGKDDPEDWQPMKGLCVRYETVRDLQGVLALLQEVERVGDYRGDIPKADRYPGILVVDEWYRLRNKAEVEDKELAKELVKLISTLAATLSSRNIHVVMTFQRGTVTFIDPDLRASLGQKAVGMVAKEIETRTVLDMVPLTVPKAQGEFLLTLDDSEPTLVPVPTLTDEGFVDVCQRAAVLREDEPLAPVLPVLSAVETPEPDALLIPDPEDEPDERTLEVWSLLHRHGPLQASVLWGHMDEASRPTNSAQLGKVLARTEGVRERWEGSTKKWELVPRFPGTPGHPRGLRSTGGFSPRQEYPEAAEHAQEDTASAVLPALQVVP